MSEAESHAWDTVAGISVINRIQAKLKKGERPTPAEGLLLAVHYVGTALAWIWKHVARPGLRILVSLTKKTFHLTWKLLKDAFKSAVHLVGRPVYKVLQFAVMIALLVGLAWLAWDIHEHGAKHPLKLLETTVSGWLFAPGKSPAPQPVAVSNPVADTKSPLGPPLTKGGPRGDLSGTEVAGTHQKSEIATSQPEPIGSAPRNDSKEMASANDNSGAPAEKTAAAPVPAQNAVASVPTLQPTPKAPKGDVIGQVAGAVGTAGTAVDAAKKIFGF